MKPRSRSETRASHTAGREMRARQKAVAVSASRGEVGLIYAEAERSVQSLPLAAYPSRKSRKRNVIRTGLRSFYTDKGELL